MLKRLWISIIFIFGFMILMGCSDPNKEADKLKDLANQLLSDAVEAEYDSYSKAYDLYLAALDTMERIVNEYPTSYLAAAISQEEVIFGEYTFSQVKDNLVPHAKLRASCETDPLFCTGLIYCQLSESIDREYFYLELSKLYAAFERYDEAIETATDIADPYYKISSICAITSRVLDSGDTYKGLGLLSDANNLALHNVKNNIEKVESLAQIGFMFAKASAHKKADKAFKEAEYISKRVIIGREKTVYALAKVSSKLIAATNYDGRYSIGAMRITNETERDLFVLILNEESVIRMYIKSGKYDEALNLIPSFIENIELISDSRIRDMCNAKLAIIYAELFNFSESEHYISLMDDIVLKEKALAQIAGLHAGSGKIGRALEVVNTIQDLAYKASGLFQTISKQPNYMQMIDEDGTSVLQNIIREVSPGGLPSCNMQDIDNFAFFKLSTNRPKEVSLETLDSQRTNSKLSLTPENAVNEVSIETSGNQINSGQLALTPEDTVKRVYSYAISGNVDPIRPYLITTEYFLRSDPEKLRKSFVGYHDHLEKLLDIEILFSKKSEYSAEVWIDFIYEHRKETANKPIELVYKDGGWKMIYP